MVKRRRSIHFFTGEEVSDEEVNMLLEAARWAPSAGNNQPGRYIIVRKPAIKEKLIAVAEQGYSMNFVRKAAVVIVVCADLNIYKKKSKRWQTLGPSQFCIQDIAAATENILLAATALGLGACWVGVFYEDKVKQVLNLPNGIRPMVLIPVGRTQSKEKSLPRKPLKDIVSFETF